MKLTILIFVLSTSLWAQNPRKPFFITPEQLNTPSLLENPPAPDSWRTRMELAELHRLQETRTDAEVQRAIADDNEEDMFIFATVLGAGFTKDKLPATALLSSHVHSDEGVVVNPAKKAFHRARPYQFDASLKPVCKTKSDPTDYAYPSGHATTGYLEAFTLVMMVPEKREEILQRADDYAHNRLVCGVHYPADLIASKDVAYAAIGIMMQNPQFKAEFAGAKIETRRALGLDLPVQTTATEKANIE